MKIKDPNDPSKEIEVFTQAELEAKVTEEAGKKATEAAAAAIEKYKQENPDKTSEIEKLKNDLASKTAELEAALGFDDGSPERKAQIERLRKERDQGIADMNKKVEDLTKTITTMQQGQTASLKKAALDKFGGKDPEKRKLVELEFDKYDPNNNTPEGIEARMQNAARIVGVDVKEQPGAMDGGNGGGARGDINNNGGKKVVTDNAKTIGGALGIKPEELQAHVDKKNGEAK